MSNGAGVQVWRGQTLGRVNLHTFELATTWTITIWEIVCTARMRRHDFHLLVIQIIA